MTVSRAPKSPLFWLGALLVIYLGYPLVAFVVRLISSPQRGFTYLASSPRCGSR